MSILDKLDFVKKAPVTTSGRARVSPIERARKKLLAEIDHQIGLAADPNYEIVKQTRKRSGEVATSQRKPKSWAVVQGGDAFITLRLSNKPMAIGGKRGGVIKCAAREVGSTMQTVREWAASHEADDAIDRMMKLTKRRKKQ